MRILMVCLGNICRSPLAEGILKSKLSDNFIVDSAGTGSWHVGSLPDRRSVEVAKKYGIDITDQRCRQFSPKDFERFDRIYVMDKWNLADVLDQATTNEDVLKVKLILEELYPDEKRDVQDPYHHGKEGFENVFKMLDEACEMIAQKLNTDE